MFWIYKLKNIKMGLFNALLNLSIDVIVMPIAIVKDVITLGGEITDEDSSTVQVLKNINEDINNIIK